ncbi:sugar ABC transporter substrate-binding protein [Bacillaceae bacterium SIJ1]|uniref:ABC transporter substrate-binding protein n=1 Tax=Litoribacterium kuwaitense TaxID=1398745 RepID=UPI0013ED5258|nr:sugar ABC transporter substrate-binding protein [Litoribacterium kuwaitense]NGP45551.1 sugar ABC transporter substrate-binding protein [Litoribacterium kuwaitense]
MKKKITLRSFMVMMMSIVLIAAAGCANPDPGSSSSEGGEEGTVTLNVFSRWNEYNSLLEDELIPEFEEQNPNIKIQLDTSVHEYPKALQAAVQGENLPDIFASHPSLPTHQLHELGVLHELDDVIGDRKDDFEEGMWTPGGTTMDGKIYAMPVFSNKKDAILMYYNKQLLEEAGLTEEDVPTSWDELVEVSKTIQENTEAHGTYLELNNWTIGSVVTQMATAITPEVSGTINYHTGEYNHNTPGVVESIEFIKKLVDEGIDEPSDKSRGPAEGAGVFAGGQAAFLFNGPWVAKQLTEEGFEDFGVAPIPTKDGKQQYVGYSGAVLKGGFHVNQKTEHFEEAKLFLEFLMDEGYPRMLSGAGYPPIPEIVETTEEPDTIEYQANKLQNESFIRTPDPVLKTIDAVDVKTAMSGKGADKTLDKVVLGYITGQVTDLEGTLQEMTDQENEAFQNALKEVQDEGADIDQSAWQFPDWEPLKPYEN